MTNLRTRTLDNAVVYPTMRLDSSPGKLLMGVFDDQGAYVSGTATERTKGETGAAVDPSLYGEPVDAGCSEGIFAGVIYNHFGHFLLESLARAWDFSAHPDATIVWAGERDPRAPDGARTSYSTLQPWHEQMLDALGITNPRLVAKYPLRFGKLHVPDLGYRYSDLLEPEHAEFLGTYDGLPQQDGARLWLSRSRIAKDVKDKTATALERRLEAAGWRIESPERLSIREQLDAMSQAEVVAGEEGSAFHLLLLLDSIERKRFQMFRRRGPEAESMRVIGDARNVNQTFHTLTKEVIVAANGREVSKLNPNAGEGLDVLNVAISPLGENPTLDPAEAAAVHYVHRSAAQRVLVAGRPDPAELRAISVPVRVAVSPSHIGDPRAYAAEGIEVFDVSLADYSAHFHGAREPYEVIILHGDTWRELHEMYITAQALGNEDTSWVILGEPDTARRAALGIALESSRLAVAPEISAGASLVVGRKGVPASFESIDRMSRRDVSQALEALSEKTEAPRRKRRRLGLSRLQGDGANAK